MLCLFIVLYGLEGLYLHVPVWMGQKGSRFREICTSLIGGEGGGPGKFLSSEQVPVVVLADVLNTVNVF